jgi:hypothetical protein
MLAAEVGLIGFNVLAKVAQRAALGAFRHGEADTMREAASGFHRTMPRLKRMLLLLLGEF